MHYQNHWCGVHLLQWILRLYRQACYNSLNWQVFIKGMKCIILELRLKSLDLILFTFMSQNYLGCTTMLQYRWRTAEASAYIFSYWKQVEFECLLELYKLWWALKKLLVLKTNIPEHHTLHHPKQSQSKYQYIADFNEQVGVLELQQAINLKSSCRKMQSLSTQHYINSASMVLSKAYGELQDYKHGKTLRAIIRRSICYWSVSYTAQYKLH